MEKEKSLGYNLFIDEDMNTLLVMMSNLYVQAMERGDFDGLTYAETNQESFGKFLDSTLEVSHKLGWCKDPNCTWEEDNKDNK